MIAVCALGCFARNNPYQGVPHNGPHVLTSSGVTVEAEDFDRGGFDRTYHFKAIDARRKDNLTNTYRTDKADPDVRFSPVNDAGGGRMVLGNIAGEDWACYTVDVRDAGVYDIVVTGSCDGNAKYSLTIDGKPIGRDKTVPRHRWDLSLIHLYETNILRRL